MVNKAGEPRTFEVLFLYHTSGKCGCTLYFFIIEGEVHECRLTRATNAPNKIKVNNSTCKPGAL